MVPCVHVHVHTMDDWLQGSTGLLPLAKEEKAMVADIADVQSALASGLLEAHCSQIALHKAALNRRNGKITCNAVTGVQQHQQCCAVGWRQLIENDCEALTRRFGGSQGRSELESEQRLRLHLCEPQLQRLHMHMHEVMALLRVLGQHLTACTAR